MKINPNMVVDDYGDLVIRNYCTNCKNNLILLRKVTEDGEAKGDSIMVCTNKECFARVNLNKLKGSWEEPKKETKIKTIEDVLEKKRKR
jgi:hypothetical protein